MKRILYINLIIVTLMLLSSVYVSSFTPSEGEIISRTWLKATYQINGEYLTVYHNLPALIMFFALFINLFYIFKHAHTGIQD